MNKGTWIAVGIAVLLGVVYLATSQAPQATDQAPYTIEKVDDLNRIEIRPPSGSADESAKNADAGAQKAKKEQSDRPSLIAFEKRKEGWWLTQPVEAPVGETTAKRFNELFGSEIETDDLQIPTDNPGEYKLDAARAVKVSLFSKDGSSPAVEFKVGEEMKVDKTDAKRTFIQPVDRDAIYRAQAAIGALVRKTVDDYRSDKIISVDRKAVSKLVIDRDDGETIELVKKMPEGGGNKDKLPGRRGNWELKQPTVDWDLDQQEVRAAVGVLTDLTAEDFADDLSAADAGLDEPDATVTVSEGDSTHEVLIGVVDPPSKGDSADAKDQEESAGKDAEPTFYAKLPGERFIYKIGSYPGDKLDMQLGEIRSKNPRKIFASEVTRIAFPGDDSVVVGRKDGSWALERPTAEKEFNANKFDAYKKAALELTVERFPNVTPEEVGLERGAEEVRIERKEAPTVRILIGERTDQGGRFVRFDDKDEVYAISTSTYDQLTVKVEDIVGESKKKGPGAMPKGMGGGPGGARGMNPAKKRQIMRQIKQKMGNR